MNFTPMFASLCRTFRKASIPQLGGAVALAASLSASVGATAQSAPKYLVTTSTTLATPSGFGGPNGNMATDQFGNLFVPDAAQSQVLEFPANGGAPLVIFNASATGPQVSGVAVDASNNLYVTTRYDGSLNATETDIFKFPYTSSGYPGAFVYTGVSPSTCSATSTSVCNYGNFYQTTGYYYQPQAIGFDGSGNGYMITTYDSLTGGGKTIFACDVQCGYDNDSATIAVTGLPTKATSLAVATNGDLYWADGSDVYLAYAGTGKPVLFDTSYESPYGGAAGVAFDRAGNLLVTNSAGTFEVPAINGVITAGNKFQVAASPAGGYTGPAVDNSGNVYTGAYSSVLKSSLYNFNFGALAIGSTSSAQTFTISFLSAGSLSSLVSLQGSVASAEFPLTPGTCTPGAYTAGQSCTFTAGFAPTAVGTRRGTVVMTDSTGAQTYVFLVGVGQGTGVAVDPGTPTAVTSTLKAPSGLALDASGNLFVADATAQAVYEYKGGTGSPIAIGAGFNKPTGVATDGAGNLYVVDQGAGTVSLFTSNAGSYLTAGTGAVLASGLTAPTDIVVSGTGTIYVTNTGKNLIEQYPNASRLGSLDSALALGTNLSGPTGLALDGSGNVYVADTGNDRIVQLGYSGAQTAIGSGLNAPTGVAAEPSGSVLIADQGNGRVVRVPSVAGTLTTSEQVVLSQPLIDPYSIRLSAAGSLYVSDNMVGAIDALQRTAGTLNFGFANVNTSTTAQTVVVSSTGTADLTLASPFFTAPPAGSGFTLSTGSGSTGCTSGTLTTGTDCTLSATFDPTSTGSDSYTAPLNTVAANAPAPTITLVGLGVNLVGVNVTLTKTSPTGTVTYGVPVVLTVTVASSSSSSTAVPTGTVTFNVDGNNSKPVTLSATGTASYTLTGLGGNTTHSVIATYNGSSVYASGSSTPYSFTVEPATTTAVLSIYAADTSLPTPISSKPGDAISFSVVITPSVVVSAGLSGTVNFVSGTQLLGSAMIAQNSSTGVYSAGISTTALTASCLSGQTLPNCSNIYQVQAVYAGNGNYSGFTTAVQPVVITPATFTVVPASTTITSTAAQYGSTTLTVTSYSGFQAGVSLTCSGLPANAYCIFRPGIISLSSISSGTGATATSSIPVQTTTMEIRVDQNPVDINSASSFGIFGLVTGFLVFFATRRRGKSTLHRLAVCCLCGALSACGIGSLTGCGTAGNPYPTPAGTYPIALTVMGTPIPNGQAPTTANVTSIATCASVAANQAALGLPNAFTCSQAGSYLITTASSSGLAANDTMTVSGVNPSAFDGNYTVLQDVGENQTVSGAVSYYDLVEFAAPSGVPATGSGGVVRLANYGFTQAYTLIVK
jgi:sugar lactone lactonase YvrE